VEYPTTFLYIYNKAGGVAEKVGETKVSVGVDRATTVDWEAQDHVICYYTATLRGLSRFD
jgi:hypothetical protein